MAHSAVSTFERIAHSAGTFERIANSAQQIGSFSSFGSFSTFTAVSFSGRTLAFEAGYAGSNPAAAAKVNAHCVSTFERLANSKQRT